MQDAMNITLENVTSSNYEAVCDLDVTDEQQDYVASNIWSLLESHYCHGHTCRAIYQNDKPAGFLMWVSETPAKVSVWRFMLDQGFQKAGIGRAALNLALNEIKSSDKVKEIEICYDPENPVAKGFYSSFGFQEVWLDKDGEDILAVIKL
ncbi:N-acetyltransferase [Pseudoalteromonas atlantica]|uniref:N-acetyltransferase n=2 Tax=Pseudoalteromonas atlantica TaxID=288 RepID=A0ABQ0UAY6_PSEAF|nr:N-acetyltransferase [Pseudoalteromonas atlantica]